MHNFLNSLLIAFLVLFLFPKISAQNFTVSGTLKDASNGEDLIGATIFVKEMPGTGASANTYGFYSLTLPMGEYTLLFRYIGLEPTEQKIRLDHDLRLNIELTSGVGVAIAEVVIKSEKDNKNVSKTEMSVTKLDPKDIENIPVIFGEKDIIKTLQLTPGVKSAGDGNAGFYVRGGASDQNLILLDEAPVYNASHLLGFFSVFNSDALKDVTLYKGTIPAEFGGRGSSVLDIKMKDGNNKKFNASGGIGVISSRLTLEGPIQKEEGSFIISARRTYADLFARLSGKESIRGTTLYFYDLNAKANYRLSEKDRLFLSGYFGRDVLGLSGFGLDWGNYTGTLRWNHLFSDRLFSNTSVIVSKYDYQFGIGVTGFDFKVHAAIDDVNLKQDFTFFPNINNTIKFGLNFINHTFQPTSLDAGELSSFNDSKTDQRFAYEGGAYVQNDWKISERWGLQYGLRYSFFDYHGKGTAYTFDEDGVKTSEKFYEKGESIQFYGGLEPRLGLKFQIDASSSIKGGVSRNMQFMHLLSNATTASPTDLWVPSSNNVKPQIVDQVGVGYFRNFSDNMFEASIETYYKSLQNQIDYRNGADLTFNAEYEGALTYGKGIAYGAEFFLKKNKGRLTGWVGYTLSRSLRKFEAINNGDYYPAKQDRIHDLSIVAMYKLRKKLTVSATWVFYTGDASTFPSGKYQVAGIQTPYYTERNGYRFPNYHRLDLGVTLLGKQRKNFESSWNFSVFNAYARQNAYSITFRENEDDRSRTEAVQTTLFSIIPAVTYNFKFK
ncbi:MAG: TonB-dependent receptor [Saprospiraceae bacterium]|nr:TonB-dependent receptor [Saprospiraceae bacterium]